MKFLGPSFLLLLILNPALFGQASAGAAPSTHHPQSHSSAKRLGSIAGAVTDQVGKPVVGASVTISGGGNVQTASSDVQGNYSFKSLAAGAYDLSVTATGYKDFALAGVALAPGDSLPVDATLDPVATAVAVENPQTPATSSTTQPAQQTDPQAAEPSSSVSVSVFAPTQAAMPVLAGGGATISGTVTDASGAVIPNATVTVTNSRGEKVTAGTNDRGVYAVNGLVPGTYDLSVSASGFKLFEAKGIALNASDNIPLDAGLEPAGQTTEVSVEGQQAAQVETETAQVAGTITQKEVLATGLNGRNFTQLIALAPGVSNQTGQDEAKVGVSGSVKYSVNGGRVEYNSFDVDGSDVLNAGLNGAESTLVVYPSLDAIGEVKVLTSNYGAMYGRSASGTVLVTTKSGSEQFHGSTYEFLRNEFFNSRNYFDQTPHAPLYRRNDFGGTIGGPLFIPGVFNQKKDKTFFFWSEEFRLEKTPQEFNQAVPTLAERNGDFSDVCPPTPPGNPNPSFTYANYPDCPVGAGNPAAGILQTFTNNQVPTDPNALSLLNTGVIPLPNSSTGCNSSLAGRFDPTTGAPLVPCYNTVISPSTYWREELFRIDHNINSKMKASFRYVHDSWDTTLATPQWGAVQNSFPTIQNRLTGPGISMVARLTDTISPSLLNEFVFSYVDAHVTLTTLDAAGVTSERPAGLMYEHLFSNGFGGKIPGIVIGGTNAAYGGAGFAIDPAYVPWNHTNPTYSVGDEVSKVVGKHTFQFGLQAILAQKNEDNAAIGAATGDLQGILSYNNVNGPFTTGNSFADFLKNENGTTAVASFQQDSAQLKYYNNYTVIEPYFQDDWRVNHHLTLNLGLRLSLFGNFHEKNLNAYNWVPGQFSSSLASTVHVDPFYGYLVTNKGNQPVPLDLNNLNPVITNGLVQCGKNGVPSSCMSSHIFNPAPRLGFAWDPRGDGKTSIRAGYGVFFEHGTGKEANTGSLEASPPLVLTMTDPKPQNFTSCVGTLGGTAADPCLLGNAFPLDVPGIPSKTIWPYVQQWSLSVQRELPKDMVATFAYVGSKGTHLTTELQLNQLAPQPNTPDTGIFLNGNPFQAGAPLTNFICNSFQGNVFFVTNPDGSTIPVTSGQPAYANLTAACFGVNQNVPSPNTLRPYNGLGRILSLQNVADSRYHAFQTTLRRTRGPLTLGVSYTFSHSLDDSSDRSDSTFVNSYDLHSNKASSNFDQRHLLNLNYIYDLGFDRWLPLVFSSASASSTADSDTQIKALPGSGHNYWLSGWQLSGITTFQSGTPFSVINGGSNTGVSVLDNAGVANGAGAGSYPDVVGNPKHIPTTERSNPQSIGPLLLNPGAFVAPQGLTFGNIGRNFLNNPHRLNFDMALLKHFKIKESTSLEFRAEAFNIFNHTQFRVYNPNLGNTSHNIVSCYGPGPSYTSGGSQIYSGPNLTGPNFSAAGGTAQYFGGSQTISTDCLTGSSFLHPVDAHRPRTLQLGLKLSF